MVVFGGEAFDVRDYRYWFAGATVSATAGKPALANMYGITETTVHVTFRAVTAADPDGPVRSPIGRPLTGQHGYVLDAHGRLAPRGAVGELRGVRRLAGQVETARVPQRVLLLEIPAGTPCPGGGGRLVRVDDLG